MSTARFILDETRALPWLACAIEHHESGQTPPEDEHLPEISEHYCPDFDDDGAETYSLIAPARDAGIITGPGGTEVYFDYSRSDGECGYVWLMYVNGPGSLKLSTYYAKMRHLGDSGADTGIQAALAVLNEAVASANELLDDLDAFVSARALERAGSHRRAWMVTLIQAAARALTGLLPGGLRAGADGGDD